MYVFDLGSHAPDDIGIDTEPLVAHQCFAAKLQQYAFVLKVSHASNIQLTHGLRRFNPLNTWLSHCPNAAATSPARSVDLFSRPSPVLNRANRRTWMFSPIFPT